MKDDALDALLAAPLPEPALGLFTAELMERIAQEQARPARIFAWIMVGILFVIVAAACVFGALVTTRIGGDRITLALALTALTLVLSGAVFQVSRA
ncbi:MAG TPA: hypothetical protein VG387_08385 [Rhizomicrobium sp.]|jgi:hypothetical protein|nr:hypothetical protein [Rhizomicrobium sp.]